MLLIAINHECMLPISKLMRMLESPVWRYFSRRVVLVQLRNGVLNSGDELGKDTQSIRAK